MSRRKIVIGCLSLSGLFFCLLLSLVVLFQLRNPPSMSNIFTPTPTRQIIASINLVDKELDDGTIQTVAELSMAPLSIGTFEVSASKIMTVSSPSLVTLAIDPGSGLIELNQTPVDPDANIPGEPDYLLEVTDELEIYPVMTAELSGANEDFWIQDIDQATKPIIFGQLTTWKWQVTPKQPGNKLLFLQISIPVEYAGQILENAQMVAQRELPVQINALPTPTFGQRVVTGAQDNAFFLIIGILIIIIIVAFLWWVIKQSKSAQSVSFDAPSAEGNSAAQLTQLLGLLDEKFDEEELQTLCFNLSIQYDNLPAKGKVYKARELIEYCAQQSRVNELIGEAEKMRPGPEWAEVRVA